MTNDTISGNNLSKIKKYHTWKIGQINLQTCSDDQKLHLSLLECGRANLDVVCFQEVRLLNTGSVQHLNYKFYWSGLKRCKRNGVGIAIRNSSDITINGIINTSDRLMAADITIKGCKLRIISCYAPTLKSSLSLKQSFYRSLNSLSKVEKTRKLMIQGDFNCEPKLCRTNSYYDGNESHFEDDADYSNENIMLFLQFCQKNKLSILNTWFVHPLRHRVTWHHPNQQTKKVYDYSLSESWIRQYVQDVRVKNSFFHSDHRLVVSLMRTPANRAARQFIKRRKAPKPNMSLLSDPMVKENVTLAIKQHLETSAKPSNLNACHDQIIEALQKGRGKVPNIPLQKQIIPWTSDKRLTELHFTRIELRKQESTLSTFKETLKQTNKKIKERVKEIQNTILKEKAKEITEAKQNRNMAKLWKRAKEHGCSSFKKPAPFQCPGLKTHFSNHFNPDQTKLKVPHELIEIPEYIQILQNSNLEIIQQCPTQDEIITAAKQLNSGKSSLDIDAEFIKLAVDIPICIDNLKNYFSQIWDTKEIPCKWSVSRITPIWKKKGNASDPSKYRGISIGSTLCKLAMTIILNRLSKFYESQLIRTQFGFRSGLGCNDGIYVIKQLQDIAFMSQRKLYCCFIDLTAAFDHVNRDFLFKSIRSRLPTNSEANNIQIIENLYRCTKSYLQSSNPVKDSFEITSGVRQGEKEGPPLYNLFSDFVLRVYENRKTASGVTGLHIQYRIPEEATNRLQKSDAPASGEFNDDDCCYADDLALLCWSCEELQICINLIFQVFSEFGLTINLTKTKTLIFNWNNAHDGEYPTSIATMDNNTIDNVDSFQYLGVWLTGNSICIGSNELNHRINSAHNAFAEHRKLLTNMKIHLSTRVMFLQSLVRSRLTYGCHAWRPNLQELSKIESAYRYFLRCMVWQGHARVNPPSRNSTSSTDSASSIPNDIDDEEYDWSYIINNQRLYQITKTDTIKTYYEQQQINWTKHIIRRRNNNVSKILTFHTTKRTRIGRKSLSILERSTHNSLVSRTQFLKDSFRKNNRQGIT